MSPQDLWDQGTPISVAGLQFAPPDMQKRYRRPRLPPSRPLDPGWQRFISELQKSGRDTSDFERSAVQLKRVWEHMRRQSHAWEEVQEYLLDGLKRGEFVAVGYEKHSKVDSKPIVIPTRFLERRFLKLTKDLISTDQYEFQFVRIAATPRPYQMDNLRKRGRPAMGVNIIQAMISLSKEGVSFNEGPQKSYVGVIQQRIKDVNQNFRIPSERTIRKMMPKGLDAISSLKAQ